MVETIFRLAHLSDPHLAPLPRVKLKDLFGKRLTGYLNYRRNRASSHDMDVLDAVIDDLASQQVDHIVCTGDLINIGLEGEFAQARAFLERLGTPQQVSCVPGNHDAYVKGAFEGLLKHVGAWMQNDDGVGDHQTRFPYVKRREIGSGAVAIVGLSSAVPTVPFSARGTLGRQQIEATRVLLQRLREEGAFRIVLIHHPPFRSAGFLTRGLTDIDAFHAMLRETGAELILCGHNHKMQTYMFEGLAQNGMKTSIPIFAAPSASANAHPDKDKRIASYLLIDVALSEQAPPRLQQVTRRFYVQQVYEQSRCLLSQPIYHA